MIVYIEYAIIDNMTIDCLLLYLVSCTLSSCARWHRIILSGIIGTICALLCPLVAVWLQYVIKAVCLPLMSVVCYGRNKLLWHSVLLLVYTFVLGGMIIALLSLLGVQYTIDNISCSYYSSVPIGMYIIALVLCVVLCMLLVAYIKQRAKLSQHIVNVAIMVGGVNTSCSGYIDSGNRLVVDGLPVCFACGRAGKLVSQQVAMAVLANNGVAVNYTTMSGSNSTVGVRGHIALDNKINSVILCASAMHSVHGSNVLINYALVEGDYDKDICEVT